MDEIPNEIPNFDDSELIICYGVDKIKLLDSIPDDILEFTENEISKSDNSSDVQNDEDIKITKAVKPDSSENSSTESPVAEDESKQLTSEVKTKTTLCKNINRKIDINGNEEVSPYETLTESFVKLAVSDSEGKKADDKELCDSGNEEADDKELSDYEYDEADEVSDSENEEAGEEGSELTERGGKIKTVKRANKNRRQRDAYNKIGSYDRAQFDHQRLIFWAGSSQVQSPVSSVPAVNSLTPIYCGNEVVYTPATQDSFDDFRAQSVSSPESGYDSAAPSPEAVADEHTIVDILECIENEESALNNRSASDVDAVVPKHEIAKLVKYLKDPPGELNEPSSAIVGRNTPEVATVGNVLDNVPFVNEAGDLNVSSVMLSPVLSSPASKGVETPKKLGYILQDKAKKELFQFLSKEKHLAVQRRIYDKIREDKNNKKEFKVIQVENEKDKKSENRTNLHLAVLNTNIEEIYNLVELHKQHGLPLSDVNIRDNDGKTALDYAIEKKLILVVNYLKENTACQSVKI